MMTATTTLSLPRNRGLGIAAILAFLAIYCAALVSMARFEHFAVAEPLFLLAVLGGAFSFASWLATRGAALMPLAIGRPRQEAATVLALYVALVVFITWGYPAVASNFAGERAHELASVGAKLVTFVLIPLLIVSRVGGVQPSRVLALGSLRQKGHATAAIAMSAFVLLFQLGFGRGLRDISSSGLSAARIAVFAPLVFAFLVIEVGIVEEFFFRTLLQARLAALLRSEAAAIVIASLLFGLMHAPGLYLRSAKTMENVGSHPSLLMAIGYSIVFPAIGGFFLGVLWSRTRNLSVVVLVHAAGDLLPGIVPNIRALFS